MTREEIQKEAKDKFLVKKRGILNISQRVGKTKICIDILKELFNYSPCVLICYPDNKIKDSYLKDFDKWNYKNTENITFCNYASIYKYEDKIFDIVVFDELHNTSFNERTSMAKLIVSNNIILGLSGTIAKDTEEELKGIGLKIVYKYDIDNAVKDKIIADYKIEVHLVNLDDKVKTPNKKGKLLTEKQKYDNYSFIIRKMLKDGKNAMYLALSRNRSALSSIGKIEYTKKLIKTLSGRTIIFTGLNKVADSLGVCSFHSDSAENSTYLNFLDGKINQLALSQMGKSGVTYNNLDNVIMMNFSYNKEETSQIMSRALNMDYNKKCANLYIVVLNEPAELKKVKESLSMLDKTKIKYI